jgi:hypothetical protein
MPRMRPCRLFERPVRWRRKERKGGERERGRERDFWRESSLSADNILSRLSFFFYPLPVAVFAALLISGR